MFCLRCATEAMMVGDSRWIASGMPARRLTAFSTRLEAACISGEFVPVTIAPSASSMAAPQKTPSLPLPVSPRSPGGVGGRLDDRAVARPDAHLLHQQLACAARCRVLTKPIRYSHALRK